MAQFQYNAVDSQGRASDGMVEAPTRRAAIARLTGQQLFVTTLNEAIESAAAGSSTSAQVPAKAKAGSREASKGGETSGGGQGFSLFHRTRVTPRDLADLWSQLSTALEAGLPLLASLNVVRDQSGGRPIGTLAEDLARRVEGGESLSDAMRAHAKTFSPLHTSMIEAGETAGVLDEVMGSLATFAERDLEVREQVRSAATYPAIVLTLAVVSVIVIVVFILPGIMDTIGQSADAMPTPTRVLLAVSTTIKGYWWLIAIGLIAVGWGFKAWHDTPEGRLKFDRFKLSIPVLGPTLRQVAVARFARALGVLSGSGIQIVQALKVLRGTLGNEVMGQTVDHVRDQVIHGQSIADPMRESGQFPEMFIQVVSLGERTGKLDQLLLKAADSFDKQTAAAIKRTMTVLPALFIVVLALVVGFILAAVLLPIVNMNNAIPGA